LFARSVKRKGSGKSIATSYIRKSLDKAKSHLGQNFGQKIKQEKLTDLPPEEVEDVNVERIRMMKQRESLRREKDLREKQEQRKRNEELAKQHKQKSDNLMKKNHTYDYNGNIIFIRKPAVDLLPNDFNISKISKKSLKKTPILVPEVVESIEDLMNKYFSTSTQSLNKEKNKSAKIDPKNYRGMENKVTPGGSNFEAISAAAGVCITEGGKNKMGKMESKNKSKSMTREEYLQTQSFTVNNTMTFQLPGIRDLKMDSTIELNSTIQSNNLSEKNENMHQSYNILPAIDASRLGNTTFQNKTLQNTTALKTERLIDRVNMNNSSRAFIEQSLIVREPKTHREKNFMRGSKSLPQLVSVIPDKRLPLSQFNPIESKVDSGIGPSRLKIKTKSSFVIF
jgi:hypothetical protein